MTCSSSSTSTATTLCRDLLLRMQQSTSPATAQANPTKAEPAKATCSNHGDEIFLCRVVVDVFQSYVEDNSFRVVGLSHSLCDCESNNAV